MPPSLRATFAALLAASSLQLASAACVAGSVAAGAYTDCSNSTCCANGFDCKRSKAHMHFAMCRPQAATGGCLHEEGWDCPGWESCSDSYGACLETKCCKDPKFGCKRRPTAMYAQCMPQPPGPCEDTADWLCPGWELCGKTYEACTNTHCCQDHRDTCYAKKKFFSQCLRTGLCVAGVDGMCEPVQSELGHCSGAYQDCHLTGCCQRAEDHCFLKNENYGKCQPHCDARANPDWSCEVRELPSEQSKLTCEALRSRNNIYKQTCATQYQSAAQCNGAYMSTNNVYQPCVWKASSRTAGTCQATGQTLACDCALLHRGCPKPPPGANGKAAASSEDDEDTLSAGEMVIVGTALMIILCGCGYVVWFFVRGPSSSAHRVESADDLDETPERSVGRKKKQGKQYGAAGLDNVEDDL